ncbi:MAG: hypothetical protein JO290_03225 [Sphingomonadaceae bacterium]|nr:hypothetical protein [Sphingomonadaceae bacterium]
MFRVCVLAVALAAAAVPAVAQREQDNAYRLAKEGQIMQLGDILALVSPHVPGKFIGSEFDADHVMYRLRYMQGNSVKNVDVDARTGRILGRSF